MFSPFLFSLSFLPPFLQAMDDDSQSVATTQFSQDGNDDDSQLTSVQLLTDIPFKPGQRFGLRKHVSSFFLFLIRTHRYPTPAPGLGDRVFYESLLREKPDSQMAQEWCVLYGVLEASEAEELLPEIETRKAKK